MSAIQDVASPAASDQNQIKMPVGGDAARPQTTGVGKVHEETAVAAREPAIGEERSAAATGEKQGEEDAKQGGNGGEASESAENKLRKEMMEK